MRSVTGVIVGIVFAALSIAPADAAARQAPFTWAHHAVSTTDAQAQQLFDEG